MRLAAITSVKFCQSEVMVEIYGGGNMINTLSLY